MIWSNFKEQRKSTFLSEGYKALGIFQIGWVKLFMSKDVCFLRHLLRLFFFFFLASLGKQLLLRNKRQSFAVERMEESHIKLKHNLRDNLKAISKMIDFFRICVKGSLRTTL